MKKVLYENKLRIDLMHVDDFLKMPKEEIDGKRILAIQENDFISIGKIIVENNNHVCFCNYNDDKFNSLLYLLHCDMSNIDKSLYDYPEFHKTIEENTNAYDAIKLLNYGFKYVVILDDLNIVIDAEDKPFPEKTLNLLSYDENIDYYSRGPVIAVQENCKETELQSMHFYPKSLVSRPHFIELQKYEFYDRAKYLNYYFNINFYVDGELVKIK